MLFFSAGRPEQGKQNSDNWSASFLSPNKYNLSKFKREKTPLTVALKIVNKKTRDCGFNDGSLFTL